MGLSNESTPDAQNPDGEQNQTAPSQQTPPSETGQQQRAADHGVGGPDASQQSSQQPQQNTNAGAPQQQQPDGQQQQVNQQQRPNALVEHAATRSWPDENKLFLDNEGNIVKRDGTVAYKAGQERRLFERGTALQTHFTELNEQYARVNRELQEARNNSSNVLGGLPKQLGLSDDDAKTALNFGARYNRDPLGTMRNLIAETVARGYTVEQIVGQEGQPGQGQGGIQTQAIASMVREALAQQQPAQQPAQGQDAAQSTMTAFVSAYPDDTRLNGDLIARVMQNDPNPDRFAAGAKAVANLRSFAANNGLDYTQPLMPQIQALRASQTQNNPNNGASPAPLPNGGTPNMGAVPTSQAQRIANEDTSYAEITRQAMRDAGMPV